MTSGAALAPNRRASTRRRRTTRDAGRDRAPGGAERRASQIITALVDPPGECPWCMSELGQPSTVGTTTRLCGWHEFTTWIQIATRYPQVWPKVRRQFGSAVLVRLVAPGERAGSGRDRAGGALVVDIAVR